MPARDRYHDRVRNALIQDGWTITHDPLRLRWGAKDMYVDLFEEPLGRLLLENHRVRLVVFDPETEVIRQWVPSKSAASW